MASLFIREKLPGEKNRFFAGLGVSLVLHVIILLLVSRYSLTFEREKIGPMEVTVVIPAVLPPPAPASAAPSGGTLSAAPAAPAASALPAASAAPQTVPARPASPPGGLSDTYLSQLLGMEESREPAQSGFVPPAPSQPVPAREPRREAGVQGGGSLASSSGPVSASAETSRQPSGASVDFAALDRALDAAGGAGAGTSGVLLVSEASGSSGSSLPGNAGQNQGQIRFADGSYRRLNHSQEIDVSGITAPPGQPKELLVRVSFAVRPDGLITGVTLDPPTGIPELNVAILGSMRNWRFEPASGSGEARAQMDLYIRIK